MTCRGAWPAPGVAGGDSTGPVAADAQRLRLSADTDTTDSLRQTAAAAAGSQDGHLHHRRERLLPQDRRTHPHRETPLRLVQVNLMRRHVSVEIRKTLAYVGLLLAVI